jgi:transcriptional regulator with PAS, ATPase and Fis domain
MVEVNCAALPRDLLESELFGHEAGAFTGARGRHRGYLEQADGGTLFLDEIGEMDLDLQAKLLTAIEDHSLRRLGGEKQIKLDVQVIVASNRDLERLVREGQFRSDLYHRLSVFRIELPPLRDRLVDLEDLVPLIIAEFNAKAGRKVSKVPGRVYRQMRAYFWPGNVRELRNVVERGVLLAEGDELSEQWLQLGQGLVRAESGPEVEGDRVIIPLDGSMALDQMDSYIIRTALKQHNHNVTATARALGTTRETLRYRIQKYHLKDDGEAEGAAAPETAGLAG